MGSGRRGLAPESVFAALSAERAAILRRSEELCSAPMPARWPFRLAKSLQALSLRIGRGVRTLFRWLSRDRDGWQCVYCGSRDELEIDHIVPFSWVRFEAVADVATG